MKQFIFFSLLSATVIAAKAQDVITLQNGQTIAGKVTEVGVNEIRYYKNSNPDGPVYVLSKGEVAQITYSNKTTDVFNSAPQVSTGTAQQGTVVVTPPQVIIRDRVRRYGYWPPVVFGHIDLGHIGFGHYSRGHHGGHH